MNKGRISTQVILCFFILMFLIVSGCGTSNETAVPAATYTIFGTVSGDELSSSSVAEVTITVSGDVSTTLQPLASGTYILTGLAPGSYTVTPTLDGYTFNPAYTEVTVTNADIPNINFTAVTTLATFTQADLVGTWIIQNLQISDEGAGWVRFNFTADENGVLACNTYEDSEVDPASDPVDCSEWGLDIAMIMDPATGVITQSGANAAENAHVTMTSNKNFVAGTGGTASEPLLIIGQKVVPGTTYSDADLQNKSLVLHTLDLTEDPSPSWRYAHGNIDGVGLLTLLDITDPAGTTPFLYVPFGSFTVSPEGIVTFINDINVQTIKGFLSNDKKTAVMTVGGSPELLIFQVTGDNTYIYPGGFLPASTYAGHMFSIGGSSFWAHWIATVGTGVWTPTGWVDSLGGSAPVATTVLIDATGVVTNNAGKQYHGQMSYDRKFIVGTQTSAAGVYSLIVETR